MQQPQTRLRTGAAWVVLILIVCQFVPLDRLNHPSPPPSAIPGEVRQVLEAHCFQCHSATTDWPKTAWIAPLSWYVTGKVHDGRKTLNFSAFDSRSRSDRKQIRNEVARLIDSRELADHGRIPGFQKISLNKGEQQRLIDWRLNNDR